MPYLLEHRPSPRTQSAARPSPSPVPVKSTPTCTVSLAHAHDVTFLPPQPAVKPRTTETTSQVNFIPFPTSLLPPHAISSRPLPVPPRARREGCQPSEAPVVLVAPAMQRRRRSRDPNVADRLVVEDPDPVSFPSLSDQPNRDQESPDKSATPPPPLPPPAYSTLPPPYSPTTSAEDKNLKKKDEPEPPVLSLPKTDMAFSSASSSSSYKRTRVSTSELRVLLYLYRTVVYGLEMRRRREESSLEANAKPIIDQHQLSAASTSMTKMMKKPLGPRPSNPSPFSSTSASSSRFIPEDKHQFESSIASAMMEKRSPHRPHHHHGFGAFPLVEDDLDHKADSEDYDCYDYDYVIPKTPFHSPSQSPRATPPPAQKHALPKEEKKKEKAQTTCKKAELNTELDVQDKLLSIRLREFLVAQGVCEDDLTVDFFEEPTSERKEKGLDTDKSHPTTGPLQDEQDEHGGGGGEDAEEGGSSVLEEYFMGIEEEEGGEKEASGRGPLVEEEEDEEVVVSRRTKEALVAPPLLLQVVSQPPPPPPPPSPRSPPPPRAVVTPSYMVALLTMRNRHNHHPPSNKKPGPGVSGSSGGGGSDRNSKKEGEGEGTPRSSAGGQKRHGHVKRRSGLSIVVVEGD